ncbi:thiolase-like protein [Mycena olivaceomarginata]|nr:thiolase-like protein [Mycena olivaceomarginata]
MAQARSLLATASLLPSDIDFVETHGTGTSLGDLIEIEGLNTVFRGSHTPDPERPLILGAAKTSIGHTEIVAGLVGIVKAIKQLAIGKVPGLGRLSAGKLNPEIDTALVPFHMPSNLTDLPMNDKLVPHRPLVVAYGFAGTLSGTILEAAPLKPTLTESPWMIFTVGAKSPGALHSYLRLYLDFCANAPAAEFRSCVVKDLNTLIQRPKDRLSQAHSPTAPSNLRVLFAFPGQGSQFYGMANVFEVILTD